jgi:hypothetical protein
MLLTSFNDNKVYLDGSYQLYPLKEDQLLKITPNEDGYPVFTTSYVQITTSCASIPFNTAFLPASQPTHITNNGTGSINIYQVHAENVEFNFQNVIENIEKLPESPAKNKVLEGLKELAVAGALVLGTGLGAYEKNAS